MSFELFCWIEREEYVANRVIESAAIVGDNCGFGVDGSWNNIANIVCPSGRRWLRHLYIASLWTSLCLVTDGLVYGAPRAPLTPPIRTMIPPIYTMTLPIYTQLYNLPDSWRQCRDPEA